jgi:hypothetical protein
MKINLGKALKSIVRVVKENPQAAIIVGTVLFPGLAKKVVPVLVAATTKPVE